MTLSPSSVRVYQWSCGRCPHLVYSSARPRSCQNCRDNGWDESSFTRDGFAGFVTAHVEDR